MPLSQLDAGGFTALPRARFPLAFLTLLTSGLVLAQTETLPARPSPELQQQVQHATTIKPGGIEEPCFSLEKWGKLSFAFSSDLSLDFNLHYHEDEVHFPIDFKGISQREGNYFAPEARQYCLMWTNRHDTPAQLEYHFKTYTREVSQ